MTPRLLNDLQQQQMLDLIYAGRKIEAIKLYRDATAASLKEAKDFVDELEAKLYTDSPEKFARKPGGCAAVLALAIVATAVLVAL